MLGEVAWKLRGPGFGARSSAFRGLGRQGVGLHAAGGGGEGQQGGCARPASPRVSPRPARPDPNAPAPSPQRPGPLCPPHCACPPPSPLPSTPAGPPAPHLTSSSRARPAPSPLPSTRARHPTLCARRSHAHAHGPQAPSPVIAVHEFQGEAHVGQLPRALCQPGVPVAGRPHALVRRAGRHAHTKAAAVAAAAAACDPGQQGVAGGVEAAGQAQGTSRGGRGYQLVLASHAFT